VTNNQFSL